MRGEEKEEKKEKEKRTDAAGKEICWPVILRYGACAIIEARVSV